MFLCSLRPLLWAFCLSYRVGALCAVHPISAIEDFSHCPHFLYCFNWRVSNLWTPTLTYSAYKRSFSLQRRQCEVCGPCETVMEPPTLFILLFRAAFVICVPVSHLSAADVPFPVGPDGCAAPATQLSHAVDALPQS